MTITPQGTTYNAFFDKLAQELHEPAFDPSEFSPSQTNEHTIQIKRIGMLGELPENITPDLWVNQDTARKLQSIQIV